MTSGPIKRWHDRPGRKVQVSLSFADIMEIALALLALSPDELAALGWNFAARKRLLEHFLAAGRQADVTERAALDHTVLPLRLPLCDVWRLQHFNRHELPRIASRAAVIDRLEAALNGALGK